MLIRVATPSDAIPLAELKRDTFRETFLHDGFGIDYPPHDLAAYEAQAYSVETITGQLNDEQLVDEDHVDPLDILLDQ
ncbi:hypothetical protein C3L29_032985, partial [Pseudomonas sp. MWU12-2534b]